MQQRPQSSIVFALIVMAIILAAASWLAISFLQNRPDAPVGQSVANVEGVDITINRDPGLDVTLIGPANTGESPRPEEIAPITPPEGQSEPAAAQPAEEQSQPDAVEEPQPQGEPATQVDEQPTQAAQSDQETTAQPAETAASITYVDHTVTADDTLYSLTTKYVTSIALLAEQGISQDDLVDGETIQIPVGNPDFCPDPNQQPYAVGEGDTAFSIGVRFNSSAEEITAINNLGSESTVYSGRIICVPIP